MATRKRRVQLPALSDPEYLSLVAKPANRSGFKMIRSEDGKEIRVRNRLKRTDQNLLSIDLPEGITREAAESLMELFGMGDEYEIQERGETAFTLKRTNSDSDGGSTVAISLGEGIIAHVAPEAFKRGEGQPDYETERSSKVKEDSDLYTEEATEYTEDGYAVARLVFSSVTYESVENVKEWLQRNDIDFIENGVEVVGDEIIVSRCESEAEGYRVPVAEGVVGVLELTEKSDIPKSIHKTVLANLLEQARTDKPTTENDEMTKETKVQDNAASDAASQESRDDEQTTTEEQAQPEQLSRDDVVAIATEAATAAATAAVETALQARDDADKETEADDTASTLKGIREQVEKMGSSLEAIRKDVDDLGDTTVTRSEPEDENLDTNQQKREDKSVFSGMFGSMS